MKSVRRFKDIELIEFGPDKYCVSVIKRFLWLKPKRHFYTVGLCGIHQTFAEITDGLTTGSRERCEYVFEANALLAGMPVNETAGE